MIHLSSTVVCDKIVRILHCTRHALCFVRRLNLNIALQHDSTFFLSLDSQGVRERSLDTIKRCACGLRIL
ncbi:unnamed protein product [Calypogeia fissa]